MFKNIDVLTKRYLQITMTYMLFEFVVQFFHVPHPVWIMVTGATIYVGFNPGTVLKRAYLRFGGTITGICAMAIMWHFIHLDYRLAVIFAVLIGFGMVFFMALPYNLFVILGTLNSDIAVEWSNTNNFSLQFYVIDRFVCTLIAFAICLVLEHIWFGRASFTDLNFARVKKNLHEEMQHTALQIDNLNLTKASLFRFMRSTRVKMNQLNTLVNDAKFERATEIATDPFPKKMLLLFREVVCVWYIQKRDPDNHKLVELRKKAHQSLSNL